MIVENQPADPLIHETAIRIAQRCRHIIQCLLREEEWRDADRDSTWWRGRNWSGFVRVKHATSFPKGEGPGVEKSPAPKTRLKH